MRMVFLVVQWEGENSVSTISESKVVLTDQSAEEDLKEGMTVQVLVGKTSKGKSTLYQATVLKIFGKYHCRSFVGLRLKVFVFDDFRMRNDTWIRCVL